MVVKLPHLEEWQLAAYNVYQQNTHGKWVVIKSIRQTGKSVLMEVLLLAASLSESNSVSMAVSPVIAQSRKLYNDIVAMAGRLIVNANSTLLEIKLLNGSTILFKSMEQKDSIRGITIKRAGIVVVDEAAYCDDDTFYKVVVPTTNVYKSDIFIVSTPKFKSGFFFDLYMAGLSGSPKVISQNWTDYDLSKFLDNETLEIYRKQLPKNAFLSEYCGQFIDGDGAVFSDFKACIGEALFNTEEELVIGIDWSTGQSADSTVLTIGQIVDNKIQIRECIAFNDLSAKDTISVIRSKVKHLVADGFKDVKLVVEQNSIGNVFYDLLFDEMDSLEMECNDCSITVVKFLTTNSSKDDIIKKVEACFEHRYIVIPNDEELLKQLSYFECKINSNKNPIYSAPAGLHDDYVMSMAFVVNALYKEIDYGTDNDSTDS